MANGPLSDQDLRDIKDSLGALDEAELEAEKAVRAGIDVGDQMKQIKDTRAKLLRIKQVYFPGQ